MVFREKNVFIVLFLFKLAPLSVLFKSKVAVFHNPVALEACVLGIAPERRSSSVK